MAVQALAHDDVAVTALNMLRAHFAESSPINRSNRR